MMKDESEDIVTLTLVRLPSTSSIFLTERVLFVFVDIFRLTVAFIYNERALTTSDELPGAVFIIPTAIACKEY